jgi:hypothetical protein
MTNVAYEFILSVVKGREYKVGCTADFMTRWYQKAVGGYVHEGYEKMYILFLTNRGRCKSDKDLETEIPNPQQLLLPLVLDHDPLTNVATRHTRH